VPLDFSTDREAIRLALEKENIESRPIWKPMPMQPVFHVEGRKAQGARRKAGNAKEEHKARGIAPSDRKRYKTGVNGGEASEDLFERELCLPSGTQMTEEDLERVVDVSRRCNKKELMSDNG
jgi:dTDP-4-amino-4,6-dideoxygalactose transaminase